LRRAEGNRSSGGDEFCRRYGLAHVPLRVVRDVDQQTAQGGRELPLAHGSESRKVARIERTQARCAPPERRIQLGEQFLTCCARFDLPVAGRDLLIRQCRSLGVGQQAVETARNVTQMKRNGRYPRRPCMQLSFCQSAAPFVQIFAS